MRDDETYTAEELAALFKEMVEDRAAAKVRDGHLKTEDEFQSLLRLADAKQKATVQKQKNNGIER